ncbi:MAG: right-handed parallel beta-helix repeat-containing protein, partial [Thermoplasmata archaeon]|nr:right-handed parallel beta-helix repeat-containing protein [Thermoplasmata archaeon]
GPGNYTTIQGAIDDANPGDVVYVYSGTYSEHVLVDKTLSLIGEDKNTTLLNGNGTGIPLNVSADLVNVTGFAFMNSGPGTDVPGLQLYRSNHSRIANSSFWNNGVGIEAFSSGENLIAYNNFSDNFRAINLRGPSNTVQFNNVSDNDWSGIMVASSTNNTISNNTIVGNGNGIVLGWSAEHNLVIDNNVSTSDASGLMIVSSGNNTVRNNTFFSDYVYLWMSDYNRITANSLNLTRIYLNYSNNNSVDSNQVTSNGYYGIYLQGSHGNTILNNMVVRLPTPNISYPRPGPCGITLWLSNDDLISGNVVTNFSRGICTFLSNFNTLEKNSPIGNTWGIHIEESQETSILGNNASLDEEFGMYIHASNSTVAKNNTVSMNGMDGIVTYLAGGGEVRDNLVSGNGGFGINLTYSTGLTLSGNQLFDDGIGIDGNEADYWNSHSIDGSNSVNGRPVLFWRNSTGGTVPVNVGQVLLANCTGVTVENQNISRADAGIQLGFSTGNDVINNNLSSNDFWGISLRSSSSNLIANNAAANNGHGIRAYNSDGNTISGNNASDNNWTGILVERSDGNTLTGNTASFSMIGIGLHESDVANIQNNVMVADGIYIWGDWGWSHTIDPSNTVNGRPVQYRKNSVGGSIPSGAGQVILVGCDNVLVEDQDLSGGSVGIQIAFSSFNTIRNVTASDSNFQGMYILKSDNNTISESNASSNREQGIYLDRSDGNRITRSVLWGNRIGVLAKGSSYNQLHSNTISENHEYGVYLWLNPTRYNTVVENTVSHNDIGIRVSSADDNIIFHNNFRDNARQALESADCYNTWYDDYPSGGNYWSDYAGWDNYSGPNQDQPGSDGIGDEPYRLGGVKDKYPLMQPFEVSRTRPPRIVDAVLSGQGLLNVTVSWSLSPDDGTGLNTVVRYDIYRNTSFEQSGTGYQMVASVANGTVTYVDIFAGEGDLNNYFYRVCAVDTNNTIVCSENQAGKYTRSLAEGPSLVSVPLIQSDASVSGVLSTVRYSTAWAYRPYDPNDKWKWFNPLKPYSGDLWPMNHTMGLWVNVTVDCNLTVAGVVPAQTTIRLYEGWNLVSFPSFNGSFTVADLKATTPVERVEMYDPASPPHYLRIALDSDVLETGDAYWVKASWDAVWIVEVA